MSVENGGWRSGHKNKTYGISTGKVGAISELMTCTDLLSKGFEVFRSISQACSCDIVASKNGKLYRVEVKTGRYKSKNSKYFDEYKNILPFQSMLSYPKGGEICDFYAIVTLSDGKVHYEPNLPV